MIIYGFCASKTKYLLIWILINIFLIVSVHTKIFIQNFAIPHETPDELLYFKLNEFGEPKFFPYLLHYLIPTFCTIHFLFVVDSYIDELKEKEKMFDEVLANDESTDAEDV